LTTSWIYSNTLGKLDAVLLDVAFEDVSLFRRNIIRSVVRMERVVAVLAGVEWILLFH
jgi:hypothetical protein